MSKKFRWGVMGPGSIAHRFAEALGSLPDAELYAVGSRDIGRARQFAGKYGAPLAFGSYEELAEADVDAIYIATPNMAHCENALLSLRHGRPVLCEKPMAINAREERRMAEAARAGGLFLMEAMWTRFLPSMVRARQLIAEGAIGEPRLLTANFSFRSDMNPASRLLNPALAGGGLLDVGIYVMSFAAMVFGAHPVEATGFAHIGETGVDEQAALLLKYPGGALGSLTCGVCTQGTHGAVICGTEGRLEFDRFWNAQSLRLVKDNTVEEISRPIACNGFEYEIIEAMECIRAGKPESPVMPVGDSIAIMETMDGFRRSWGLRYPGEGEGK